MGALLRAVGVRWGLLLGGGLALAAPFGYAVLPSVGKMLWAALPDAWLAAADGAAAAQVSDSGAQWAAAGGWAIPLASTGRLEWPALAAACESATDSAEWTERSERAKAAYAELPDAHAFGSAIMARIEHVRAGDYANHFQASTCTR